jgi:hypothetical protein
MSFFLFILLSFPRLFLKLIGIKHHWRGLFFLQVKQGVRLMPKLQVIFKKIDGIPFFVLAVREEIKKRKAATYFLVNSLLVSGTWTASARCPTFA